MHQHGYCRSFLQGLCTLVRKWIYLPACSSARAWISLSKAISRVTACSRLVSGYLQYLFISNESFKAPTTQFGRLPDAVLLHIFKDYCDADTQQLAYQSCKEIRDFCNRYMKSVWVHIYKGEKFDATRNITTSSNICPRGAHGIEHLLVHLDGDKSYIDQTIAHLEQLISDASMPDMPAPQLHSISNVEMMLPWWFSNMTDQQQQVVSRLLAHCQNLDTFNANASSVLACAPLANLKQVRMKRSNDITPEQFQRLADGSPQLHSLEFTIAYNTQPVTYQPALLCMKALKHLYFASGTYMSKNALLTASMLTGLTQLTHLTIKEFVLYDAHLLTQLSLTHLTLIGVRLEKVAEQQQPAAWPSLKSIQIIHSILTRQDYVITETTARAILPVPRPGFGVTWPAKVTYVADVPPHPLYGYMGAAHMKSFNGLRLTGTHVKAALQSMVEKQVPMQSLQVIEHYTSLEPYDIATHLAFPYVVYMQLLTLAAVTPEFVTRLLQQCPTLEVLTLNEHFVKQRVQLDQSVTALGYSCSYNGMTATITRPCCDEVSRQRQAAERHKRFGNILLRVDASTLPACTHCRINKLNEDGTYAK